MKRPLFITGTDTGVGKTTVACGIVAMFRLAGFDVGVMKPVETGVRGRSFGRDSARLRRFAASSDRPEEIAPYAYPDPVSPWVAATRSGRPIQIRRIVRAAGALVRRHSLLVMEGVGGVLVPLTRRSSVLDLVARLGADMLLVASDRVGTINHTLLSLRAAEEAGVSIIGVVVNSSGEPLHAAAKNTTVRALERLSGISVWGRLPRLDRKVLNDPERLAGAVGQIVPMRALTGWIRHGPEFRALARPR